jgi:ABC-type iron transport system FetAB ATPase subunit
MTTANAAPPRLSLTALQSPLAGPFSLDLAAGRCAVVTGESGSGKSLFLRMIADLDPNDGEARLDGVLRETFAPPAWRSQVTYVAAEAGWWADDVADHYPKARLDEARGRAAALGLHADLIGGPVARLSSGERQRLALIRALLLTPSVLLLDEPTGALDEDSTRKVEAVVREAMQSGASVVMVTHDQALAARIADQRYRMADRKLSVLP